MADALEVGWSEVLVVFTDAEVEHESFISLGVAEEEGEAGEVGAFSWLGGVDEVLEGELAEARFEG